MKYGSEPSVRGGRANTKPTARARESESARAAVLGRQPISCAIVTTRCRVCSETPGCPFNAQETDPFDTPAARAISVIVSRRIAPSFHVAGRPAHRLTKPVCLAAEFEVQSAHNNVTVALMTANIRVWHACC